MRKFKYDVKISKALKVAVRQWNFLLKAVVDMWTDEGDYEGN